MNYRVQNKQIQLLNLDNIGVAEFHFVPGHIPETLGYQLNVTNMSGITGAHIHSGKQGENGDVVATLFNPNMTAPPTGKVNGLLAKGVIKAGDLQGPLKGHSILGLIMSFGTPSAYVNIHTQQHQSGEIRGQITGIQFHD